MSLEVVSFEKYSILFCFLLIADPQDQYFSSIYHFCFFNLLAMCRYLYSSKSSNSAKRQFQSNRLSGVLFRQFSDLQWRLARFCGILALNYAPGAAASETAAPGA